MDISKVEVAPGAVVAIRTAQEFNIESTRAVVKLAGTVENRDEKLVVNLNISGNLDTECSRCLTHVTIPYNENFSCPDYFCGDNRVNGGNEIDLFSLAVCVIRADIHIAPVCSEGCRGLCCYCGANLNDYPCNCEGHNANTAFDGLKEKLFNDNEEV